MKKRILSILLTLCIVICLVPTALQAEEGDVDITQVNLKGLSSELWSYKDLTFATIDDDAGYTIKDQVWSASGETSIRPDSANLKPKAGKEYTFVITLEAKDGYVFPIKNDTNVFYDGTLRLDGTEYDNGVAKVDGKTLQVMLFMLTKVKGAAMQDVSVSTEDELTAALADGAISVIRLAGDIDLTAWNASTVGGLYVHLAIAREVNIDLNGYVLKGTGANSRIGIFEVTDGGDLTIIDSRPTAPHRFTDSDGLWVLDEQNGDKTVNGGIITGGSSAINVGLRGKVTMNGGSIVGCRSDSCGGGVFIDGGVFEFNDGAAIIGCTATSAEGGGVFMEKGTFTMSGGNIQDCRAYSSSGVYVESGLFELKSGSVQNCLSMYGSAVVYVYMDGTFTMTGGEITGSAENYGVYLNGATMNANGGTVDGTVKIDAAYDSASNSNVYGVIQGGGSNATHFSGDVTNYGEIKHGIFSGTVMLGNSTFSGTISGGVFNKTVTINRGEITNGTFNKDVVVDNVQVSFSCTTLAGGTYNGLIINKSTYAAFAGAHSPLGIVGEKPSYNPGTYFKVTFDPAGGQIEYPDRYFLYDGNISDKIVPDFRAGYFFAGWYNGENKWNYSDTVGEYDLTLTAHWTACDHSGHTGEKPTCTTSVICTECSGTIAALGHDFSASSWQHDVDTHWKKCARCDVIDDKEPHDWDSGKVTVKPTCMTAGEKVFTCDKCSATKIESIQANGHSWTQEWQHDATHHWHDCSDCDEKLDHDRHAGGTATCSEKAKCEVCGEDYGDLDPGNHAPGGKQEWTKTATSHEQKWSCCGAVIVTSEDHEWANGVCEECGYECEHDDTDKNHICDICGKVITNHVGGKATCTEKAICEACGKAYGETDLNNHAGLKHIDEKPATKDAEGNIEYWYCEGCGKYYSDAAATKEIKKTDTVTAKLPDGQLPPKTGDKINSMLWIALLFISGGVCTVLTVKRKKSY